MSKPSFFVDDCPLPKIVTLERETASCSSGGLLCRFSRDSVAGRRRLGGNDDAANGASCASSGCFVSGTDISSRCDGISDGASEGYKDVGIRVGSTDGNSIKVAPSMGTAVAIEGDGELDNVGEPEALKLDTVGIAVDGAGLTEASAEGMAVAGGSELESAVVEGRSDGKPVGEVVSGCEENPLSRPCDGVDDGESLTRPVVGLGEYSYESFRSMLGASVGPSLSKGADDGIEEGVAVSLLATSVMSCLVDEGINVRADAGQFEGTVVAEGVVGEVVKPEGVAEGPSVDGLLLVC